MALPKSFTTVTTFSKLLAMFLFILFPFIGFYAGMKYQDKLTMGGTSNINKPKDLCALIECAGECKNNKCYLPTPFISPSKSASKMCPNLAFKNSKGKTCVYTGPECSLSCK